MKRLVGFVALTSALTACHHTKDTAGEPDMSTLGDMSASSDAAEPGNADAGVCTRAQRPDGPRFAVVSHPFDESGNPATDFEVLALATDGTFSRPNTHFQMNSATDGAIVFTPDGKIGFVPQGNSHSIGIFSLSDTGVPTVVNAAFDPKHGIGQLYVSADGEHLYVVDLDTTSNGGGIYDYAIHCDGSLGDPATVVSANTPAGLAPLPGGDYVMYAQAFTGSPSTDNVHRFTLAPFSRIASGSAVFAGATDIVVGSATATHDGKYYLVGDNSSFSSNPNSIAFAALPANGVTSVSTATTAIQVNDPYAMVASPFDNAVLVVSGFGNAFYKLTYDPTNTTSPFGTKATEITYKTGQASPQIPGNAQLIDHGALANHVFVAELSGIRQVQFGSDGTITDLGLYDLGMANTSSLGIMGIQP